MRMPRSRVLVVAVVLLALVPGIGQAVPDELQQRLEQARVDLADLDAQVSLAVEEYNAAAARLERLRTQQQETARRVDALTAEADHLEDVTAGFVRSMYIRGPASGLTVALDSAEISEASRDMVIVDRLARQRHAELERLGTIRAELETARTQLAEQVSAATGREQELARRRDEVQQMVADQGDQVAALQDRIATIEAEEAAAAQRQREAAAERARRASEAASEAAAPDTPAQASTESTESAVPTTSAPESAPPPPDPPPAPPPGTRAGADTAVQAALSQVGKPYEYAAAGPDSYDCSGLTMWAWQHAGVSLPHSSRMQHAATTRISRDQLQAGDLVFYGSPIHHVAMYLDGTRVVEAPYTGANVRIREDGLLRDDIAGYGRV